MKRNNISSLRHEISRQRRNNVLLLLIVFLYAFSWLPFNISYILFIYLNQSGTSGPSICLDISFHLIFFSVNSSYRPGSLNDFSTYLPFRFLICMISAISNPFLYSYFNETFKDGFEKIFKWFSPRLAQALFHRLSLHHHHHQNFPLQIKKHSHEHLPDRTNPKTTSNEVNEAKERMNPSWHIPKRPNVFFFVLCLEDERIKRKEEIFQLFFFVRTNKRFLLIIHEQFSFRWINSKWKETIFSSRRTIFSFLLSFRLNSSLDKDLFIELNRT